MSYYYRLNNFQWVTDNQCLVIDYNHFYPPGIRVVPKNTSAAVSSQRKRFDFLLFDAITAFCRLPGGGWRLSNPI